MIKKYPVSAIKAELYTENTGFFTRSSESLQLAFISG